jgi:hypothetical protein
MAAYAAELYDESELVVVFGAALWKSSGVPLVSLFVLL